MILETKRLLVREWLESDVAIYMTLSRDVGYNCFSLPGFYLVRNADEALQKVRERISLFGSQRLGKFPVFLKEGGEFVGTCGLEPCELDGQTRVELGYRFCLKHWGKGFATEAAEATLRYGFDDLELRDIIAFAVPQNGASVRVLEKLGGAYLRDVIRAEIPHRLYEFQCASFLRGNATAGG